MKSKVLAVIGLGLIFLALIFSSVQAYSDYSYYKPWFQEIGLDFLSRMLNEWGFKCKAGWKCLDEYYSGYLKGNCYFENVRFCGQGCFKGKCLEEQCQRKWLCLDEKTKGLQKKDCSIAWKRTCKYGCNNGRCQPKSRFQCQEGWHCQEAYQVYLDEKCQELRKRFCIWGCRDNKCLYNSYWTIK